MQCFQGKSVYKGIAMGPIVVLKKNDYQVKRTRIEDTEAEVKRVDEALKASQEQLQKLYDKALREVGESGAAIFEVHQMMLDDEDYLDSIDNIIRTENVNAEYAVATTGDNFADMFAQMDDDYMKARAADIKDISDRLVRVLSGHDEGDMDAAEPSIIVAEDLAPSETVQMDKSKVLAFVTRKGSSNSHTAILARTMNIPALINIEYDDSMDGKMAVVDGKTGSLIVEPDADTLKKYQDQKDEELRQRAMLKELKGKTTETKSGHKIHLYANIGSTGDVASVLANDAEGIGLFRSEFIYLEKDNYPTEEEQFQIYKAVAQNMAGKKVIIRTLDIGGDKTLPYFPLPQEQNPFLGKRALRLCFDSPELFRTQLRAALRASVAGQLWIMLPMVSSIEEIKRAKALLEQAKQELRQEKLPFDEGVKLGIMIEIPAVAVIADLIAPEVDFASIGTNDLCQYLMAVDRMNPEVTSYYQSYHPALFRLIGYVVERFKQAGKPICICGELGGDPLAAPVLVGLGMRKLSMSLSSVAAVKRALAGFTVKQMEEMARAVENMTDGQAREYLQICSESLEK